MALDIKILRLLFENYFMKKAILLVLLIFTVFCCKNEDKVAVEIEKINVDIAVERFDRAFAAAEPKDLANLKKSFPFLFSKRIPDSVWVNRMEDTLQQQLFGEVGSEFEDFQNIEQELSALFQHLKYYDKSFKAPRVITLTNDVDYRYPVVVTDSLVLIALDNYLGKDHEFYANISDYLKQDMDKNQIVVDIAEQYARRSIFPPEKSNFLEEMIYFGKILYFKDRVIPFKTDAEKIAYTKQQLQFANLNEEMIWTHFVEKETLFDGDDKLVTRFIAEAPFSKFYLEIDNQSPGRLGQYIGWQIVRAYMINNDVDFMQMMQTDPTEIFNKSNYKPAK